MATATLITDALAGWAPDTRQYVTSDGKYLAVEAASIPDGDIIPPGDSPLPEDVVVKLETDGEVGRQAIKYVARPAVVFLCDADGLPVDADENDFDPLTPLATFPAGTSHTAALTEMGYEVT